MDEAGGTRIAVAIPARNEAENITACVSTILAQARGRTGWRLGVHILANNCTDDTAARVRTAFRGDPAVSVREVTLLPEFAHAGWARRLAMEQAAEALGAPGDLLLATDADSVVAPDWIARTTAYCDHAYDAVAGYAIIRGRDWRGLDRERRERLILLGKYKILIDYLRRGRCDVGDPWPSHGYEGGASIAMTHRLYREIGGCPPLPVGEDRALFDAIRRHGGRIRHARDVKVYTSGRLAGRAQGGVADTLSRWCSQPADRPIQDTWPINVELGLADKADSPLLTFRDLPWEVERAKGLARAARASEGLALSA
jgi:GT2 family glycosyltransferase